LRLTEGGLLAQRKRGRAFVFRAPGAAIIIERR